MMGPGGMGGNMGPGTIPGTRPGTIPGTVPGTRPGTVPGTGEGLRWIMLSLALMLLAALGCVTVWFTALLKGRSA